MHRAGDSQGRGGAVSDDHSQECLHVSDLEALVTLCSQIDTDKLANVKLSLEDGKSFEVAGETFCLTAQDSAQYKHLVPFVLDSATASEHMYKAANPLSGAFILSRQTAFDALAPTNGLPAADVERRRKSRKLIRKSGAFDYKLDREDEILGIETARNSMKRTPLEMLRREWTPPGAVLPEAPQEPPAKRKKTTAKKHK